MIKKMLSTALLFTLSNLLGAGAAQELQKPYRINGGQYFSPDGNLKVVLEEGDPKYDYQDDGRHLNFSICDVQTKSLLWSKVIPEGGFVLGNLEGARFFSFSPGSKYVVLSSYTDGVFKERPFYSFFIVDARTGKPITHIKEAKGCPVWHHNDDFLSYQQFSELRRLQEREEMVLFNLSTQSEQGRFLGERVVSVLPEYQRCVVSGFLREDNGTRKPLIRLYDISTRLEIGKEYGTCVSEEPDQQLIALHNEPKMHLYDPKTLRALAGVFFCLHSSCPRMVWSENRNLCALLPGLKEEYHPISYITDITALHAALPRGFIPDPQLKNVVWSLPEWSKNAQRVLLKPSMGLSKKQLLCVVDVDAANEYEEDRGVFYVKSKKHIILSALLTASAHRLAVLKANEKKSQLSCSLYFVGDEKRVWKLPIEDTSTTRLAAISPEGTALLFEDNSAAGPGYSLYRATSRELVKTAAFTRDDSFPQEPPTLTDDALVLQRQRFALEDGRMVKALS